jgi:hypothetical protein
MPFVRSPTTRGTSGNKVGLEIPRLKIVTSKPADKAASTIGGPTKTVPPNIRSFLPLFGDRPLPGISGQATASITPCEARFKNFLLFICLYCLFKIHAIEFNEKKMFRNRLQLVLNGEKCDLLRKIVKRRSGLLIFRIL